MDYKIRAILEGEVSSLQDFLYEATFVPEGLPAPPISIINQPELQIYISDFGNAFCTESKLCCEIVSKSRIWNFTIK